MADVAVDARQSGTSSVGATSLSWSHTVTSSFPDLILLANITWALSSSINLTGVAWDDGGTPAAMTKIASQQEVGFNDAKAEIWYVLSPVPGTKTIKATFSGSCPCTSGSISAQNVSQTSPFNAASPQTQTGTQPTLPSLVVTSAAGELVVDCTVDNLQSASSTTLVPGAGQTQIHSLSVGTTVMSGASSDEPGAPTVTMSWTGYGSLDPWALVAVSLNSADAPPLIFRNRKLATQQRMVA